MSRRPKRHVTVAVQGVVGQGGCLSRGRSPRANDHIFPYAWDNVGERRNWQPVGRPKLPFCALLMDIDMQSDSDMSADGRWLNYDQLAALRQIDRLSAIKLATRKRWERRKGNTGQMQVLVPIDWLERAQGRRDKYRDKSLDDVREEATFDAALKAVREAKDGEIAALRAVIEAKDEHLSRALADRDHYRGLIEGLRERADRAEQGREEARARLDVLREQLAADRARADQADGALQQAQAMVEAMSPPGATSLRRRLAGFLRLRRGT